MKSKKKGSLANDLIETLLNDVTKNAGDVDATVVPEATEIVGDEASESKASSVRNSEEVSDNENTVNIFSGQKGVESKLDSTQGTAVGSPVARRSTGDYSETESYLIQAENLRLAQSRVRELENEVDRLRQLNEELGSAGDLLSDKVDELMAVIGRLEADNKDLKESGNLELEVLKENMRYKEQAKDKLALKVEELEHRLSNDLKRIRVRERELENRLELSKMESAAIARTKDETILELKRKIDHQKIESDNYKSKCHELNEQINEHQEQFRRTIRALRLALANLEGSKTDKSGNG